MGRYDVDARYLCVTTTTAEVPPAAGFSRAPRGEPLSSSRKPLADAASVAPATPGSADTDVPAPAPASPDARTNSRYAGWSRSTRTMLSCPCTRFTAMSFRFSKAAKSFCCFLNALFFRSSVTSGGRDGNSRLA